MPDALIEDNCQSIGGGAEMVYPQVRSDLRQQMTSFVVREFEGIDHLPDDLTALREPNATRLTFSGVRVAS